MDGVLLYGAKKSDKIDKWLKADKNRLEKKLEEEQAGKRKPLTTNIMIVLMVAFA
jgi:hypothetical protein